PGRTPPDADGRDDGQGDQAECQAVAAVFRLELAGAADGACQRADALGQQVPGTAEALADHASGLPARRRPARRRTWLRRCTRLTRRCPLRAASRTSLPRRRPSHVPTVTADDVSTHPPLSAQGELLSHAGA